MNFLKHSGFDYSFSFCKIFWCLENSQITIKITYRMANRLDGLPKSYSFTYADFIHEVIFKKIPIKAMYRMVLSGKMSEFSKGSKKDSI